MLDITYFPWAECVIAENRNLYVADTLSGKRRKRNLGFHRYEFELTTIDMDLREGMAVTSRLSAAVTDDLTYIHPRLSYSAGLTPVSGLELSRPALKGDLEIYVKAGDSSQPWSILVGDFLNIGTDTKVFQCSESTIENVGEKMVTLTHPVRNDTPVSHKVKVNDVMWVLQSDGKIEYEMVASENQDIPFTLLAVEKL